MSREFVLLCRSVEAKRPRTVIEHILRYGVVNNDELRAVYGYSQGARAARDVREQGIPLNSHRVSSTTTGRSIAAYTFGSLSDIRHGRHGGRRALPKSLKTDLLARNGARDAITGDRLEARFLQVDHRVPYEIDGDPDGHLDPADFMLVDASTQRTKSSNCERCPNWQDRDPETCRGCFWAFPEAYEHVATVPERRSMVVWRGGEVDEFVHLVAEAQDKGLSVSDLIKTLATPENEAEAISGALLVLKSTFQRF